GVAILLHESLNFSPKETISDLKGRYVVVSGLLFLDIFTFVNVYAPNREDPGLFAKLLSIISKLKNTFLIVDGDFNLVVNSELDRSKGKAVTPRKSLLALFELMMDCDLHDIWRLLHPSVKDYTFTSTSRLNNSRIDFLLISAASVPVITTACIHPMVISDHSPPPSSPRWRLNTFLLRDPKIVKAMEESLEEYVETNLTSALSAAVFWETLKYFIKGTLISISTANKKNNYARIAQILDSIREKERELYRVSSLDVWRALLLVRVDYDKIMLEQAVFAIEKSKLPYLEKGEKAGRFLSQRLKKQEQSRSIPVIYSNSSSALISDPHLINDTFAKFHRTLYDDEVHPSSDDFLKFFSPLELPQLNAEQTLSLNVPFTVDAIVFAI
uniref:Uncharacterized protein n=1 Tax=Latimeria chalumnae TaxID=7897 RepID=H3A951_LATCH